jgi:hypothetical protein
MACCEPCCGNVACCELCCGNMALAKASVLHPSLGCRLPTPELPRTMARLRVPCRSRPGSNRPPPSAAGAVCGRTGGGAAAQAIPSATPRILNLEQPIPESPGAPARPRAPLRTDARRGLGPRQPGRTRDLWGARRGRSGAASPPAAAAQPTMTLLSPPRSCGRSTNQHQASAPPAAHFPAGVADGAVPCRGRTAAHTAVPQVPPAAIHGPSTA